MVSNKKNKLTSAAGINLGAIVTSTKGIATQRIHIKGTIIKSVSAKAKLSIKNKANTATNSLPTTAAGTKFFDFADLMIRRAAVRSGADALKTFDQKLAKLDGVELLGTTH